MFKNRIKFFPGLVCLIAVWLLISPAAAARASSTELVREGVQEVLLGKSIDRSLVEVVSRVSQVVIYPDRAQVVRIGEVNLTPETRSLLFRGLPGTMVPDSVRVTARSTSAVKIMGVEVQRVFLEAEQLPEVKKIKAEISSVEAEINRIKGQEAILEAQEKFLNSLGSAWSSQASRDIMAGHPDLTAVDKFVEYLGQRLQTIQKSRQENARLLVEQQNKLEALKKKLGEIMPASPREQYDVYVLIESASAGLLQVELTYAVGQAYWKPVYAFKALPETGEIELNFGALVKQKTGENWDNVSLVLSTSRPTAGYQPGQLSPWYLDFAQPRLRMASRELSQAKMALVEEAAPAPVMEETAETVETWSGVNFEVKKPWTVPSDGAERRVPVDVQKIPSRFDYLTIPKLQELAFLRSSFKNSLPYTLLPGRADLFIGQDYVGAFNLELVPAGDELKLFFGEDRQVKVKRELVRREKSGPGFLGKNERVTQVFKITVENLRKRPVEVEVQDQIPVSQNTKIEVKEVKIAPAPSRRDEKGILSWELRLNPGQKQEITIEFSVEYPKDSRIIGI